jgi:hypothetical protein
MNTKITYLYRDAGNYKTRGEEVISLKNIVINAALKRAL